MDKKSAVSKVITTLRLKSADEHISRRYILKLLEDSAKNLISHKLLDRSIGQEYNLYSQLTCVEMRRIEKIECPFIEFNTCSILMKSVKPLPESVYSRLGASIKEVTSIDGQYDFTVVEPRQYRRNKERKYQQKKQIYCFVDSDRHLYIADHEIYAVNVKEITMDTHLVDGFNSCKKCDECKSPWLSPFICPDKLISTVFNEVYQTLGVYKQIPPDENQNGNENIKN